MQITYTNLNKWCAHTVNQMLGQPLSWEQRICRHGLRDKSGANGKSVIVRILKNMELNPALRYRSAWVKFHIFQNVNYSYRLPHFFSQ